MSKEHPFTWSETDEPHASRRKMILAKHPEIAELFGREPMTFYVIVGIFLAQVAVSYYMREASWWLLFSVAYVFGGTVNHTLQLAVHDLSHNLCFETTWANKVLSIFANLVTGVPSGISFIRYHMEHHRAQGSDGIDMDIPTDIEVQLFTNTFTKVIWVLLQPFFYALRPVIVKPRPPTAWEGANWAAQLSFDFAIFYFFGGQSLVYLIAGSLLGMGLHPAAGHFIAEHYTLTKGYETYSYYGPMNFFNLNVGYHNEHHDFPRVPWTKLPLVKKMAPEFYDNLPSYTSYAYVFWRYITDPEIGPWSRVKRHEKHITATAA